MAERSFAKEVESLRLGAGETFEGEAILAVTKALLQAGVGYVGGYQGAPPLRGHFTGERPSEMASTPARTSAAPATCTAVTASSRNQ